MIRAANDNIVIEPEKIPETTAGGLYIPENRRRVPKEGKVLSVGPSVELGISEGDWVIFSRYSEVRVNDDEWIVNEKDIICKMEK